MFTFPLALFISNRRRSRSGQAKFHSYALPSDCYLPPTVLQDERHAQVFGPYCQRVEQRTTDEVMIWRDQPFASPKPFLELVDAKTWIIRGRWPRRTGASKVIKLA